MGERRRQDMDNKSIQSKREVKREERGKRRELQTLKACRFLE